MSEVTFTKCDVNGCGLVTPDDPNDPWSWVHGWSRLRVADETYDLCPSCTDKLFEELGIKRGDA